MIEFQFSDSFTMLCGQCAFEVETEPNGWGLVEEEWVRTVSQRVSLSSIPPQNPIAEARQFLFGAYTLASEAPPDVLMRFSAVPAASFEPLVQQLTERMHKGLFEFNLQNAATTDNLFLRLVTFIRALDDFLCQTRTEYGSTAFPEEAWAVEAFGREGFLVPRSMPRRSSDNHKRRDDLGTFVHRALKWHRVLPRELGGYRITLNPVDVALGAAAPARKYGGALFENLDLDVSAYSNVDHFRVDSVICQEIESAVEDCTANAHIDGCAVLTFPELTIDPTERSHISYLLKSRPWNNFENATPWTVPLVVAGSWHENRAGKWYNIATVLDGYGDVVAEHLKIFPYLDGEGKLEDIDSGKCITVLVMDDSLAALGICRDFCERGGPQPNPYSLLDVDLFLITSYGDARTMAGHFATATDVQIRFRSEVFVVQQAPSGTPGALGFVLTPGAGPAIDFAAITRRERWRV